MEWCFQWTFDCVNTYVPIATAIGSLATAVMVAILYSQTIINKKQLAEQQQDLVVSNFALIANEIDDAIARACRNVMYNSHNLIIELSAHYERRIERQDLYDLNEIAKYTAGIYEKVGFLLENNKYIKEKILNSHGFTIGRLWVIIQPLITTWQRHDHVGAYDHFGCLGRESYRRDTNRIDDFIEHNYNQNPMPVTPRRLVLLQCTYY